MPKFPKKIKETLKKLLKKKLLKKKFFTKKCCISSISFEKMSQKKVHKMLERQMNIYVPTFMKILLFQAYRKQNTRLK